MRFKYHDPQTGELVTVEFPEHSVHPGMVAGLVAEATVWAISHGTGLVIEIDRPKPIPEPSQN